MLHQNGQLLQESLLPTHALFPSSTSTIRFTAGIVWIIYISKVSFDPNLLLLLNSDFYRAFNPWNLWSSRCQWLSLMNPQTLKKQVQHFPPVLKDVCWFCKICIYPASTQRTHVVLFACSKDKCIHFALLSRVKSAGKNSTTSVYCDHIISC